MLEIQLQVSARMWKNFVSAAERKSRKPQALVKEAMRNYLQRLEDEELLKTSCEDARRSGFDFKKTDEAIKDWRKKNRQEQGSPIVSPREFLAGIF